MEYKGWQKFLIVGAASGGFVGYFPIASGTVGSLIGVALVLLTHSWGPVLQILIAAGLLVGGVYVSEATCRILKKPDSGRVVIDEIVGMLITMIGLPVTPYWLVIGFLIFRALDILKLPPANYFDEKVKNGWGVMMDDVLAGIYGNIILHLVMKAQL